MPKKKRERARKSAERVAITSLRFSNFKALSDFSVSLRDMNILVGPNNYGKSTILSAFRVLAACLRKATSRSPESVRGPDGRAIGWKISDENIPISLENVHTDGSDADSSISFMFSNKRSEERRVGKECRFSGASDQF